MGEVAQAAAHSVDQATYSVANVRLPGKPGLWQVTVIDGRLHRIDAHPAADVKPGEASEEGRHQRFDGGGALLLPGFADAHVHIDKAFQLQALTEVQVGGTGLDYALAATTAVRRHQTPDLIRRRAERLVGSMIRGGTVSARVHVEISPHSTPGTVERHQAVMACFPELAWQLVAFPQNGTTSDKSLGKEMRQALESGCTVVGACPYADPDPLRHLDEMVDLAVEHELPLDLHLDLSDDPRDLLLDQVVIRVERAGLQGRVNVGHETTLTALPPRRRAELGRAVAGAGITITSLPTTDLYLSGRRAESAPTRGITPIKELLAAGVQVALASNNHQNAFTPVSMPSLSHAAWIASLSCHMGSEEEQLALLAATTTVPAAILGGDTPAFTVGQPMGANLFDAAQPVDVVRMAAMPLATLTQVGIRRHGTGLPLDR